MADTGYLKYYTRFCHNLNGYPQLLMCYITYDIELSSYLFMVWTENAIMFATVLLYVIICNGFLNGEEFNSLQIIHVAIIDWDSHSDIINFDYWFKNQVQNCIHIIYIYNI